jgi:translation initiation factor IF-2
MARTIEIEDTVTVGTLAERLSLPVTRLIGELMKNGVMATVNERIDFDTAQIIVTELGLDIELARKAEEIVGVSTRSNRKNSDAADAETRPPVVAVMGHVDHGKTSLLDALLSLSVAKGEAGGITQHISAYQVDHTPKGAKTARAITFLDTPGHEAFAAIREHGAQLTDLVVLVVAADDGVKPQTLEAIRFARKAGVKIIVAINKMDKEGANPDRIKQQLSEQELLVEEWGGDTVVQEVSAKTKAGIPELLDMILLVADVEDLKARVKLPASGLIIEARIEQGRGPVAHALVEEGTLKRGDFVVAGGTYARVRNLETTTGKVIAQAGPSTPVVMTGFKAAPEFGDQFKVVANEKAARALAETNAQARATSGRLDMNSNELIRMINRGNKLTELNVIVKADVQGSLTSVIDSIKTLDTDEVAIRIVASGVGSISENDVQLANTTGAIIYGFNVVLPANVRQLASRDKISIRLYNVIYELIDDAKAGLSNLLADEIIETETGRLIIRGIFKTTKTEVICGGEVTKGKAIAPALVKIYRGDEMLDPEVEVTGLKSGPTAVREVDTGQMCGVSLHPTSSKGKLDLQEGDRLEFFTRTSVERTL